MSELWKSMVNLLDEIGEASGCHRMPERSFFFRGRQFPVCARCTGVFAGQSAAVIVGFFRNVPLPFSIALLGIMGADWGIQEMGIRESNNTRRFITGTMGGFGLFSIYIFLMKKAAAHWR